MSWPNRNDFIRNVVALADGEAIVVDARGLSQVSVIANTGATVTWTREDSASASTHSTLTGRVVTPPAAEAIKTLPVDWGFYRISTAGAGCWISAV